MSSANFYNYIAQAYRILGLNTAAIAASWASASVKMAWLKDTYVADLIGHTSYNHIMAAEASTPGYPAGGFNLQNKGATTFSESPFSEHLICSPTSALVASASDIRYAAVYEVVGSASNSHNWPLRILYTLDNTMTNPHSTLVWCYWDPRGIWSHYQGQRLTVYEGHFIVGNRGHST